MVQLKNFVAFSLLASGIAFALPNPVVESGATLAGSAADLADGLYSVDVLGDGSTTWNFVTPVNETLEDTHLSARNTGGLDKRDGVTCQGSSSSGNDIYWAWKNLAQHCGNGYYFSGKSLAYSYGGAVAYVCNYGKGQTCYSNDIYNDMGSIDRTCGFNPSGQGSHGWYSHDSWKLTYGRTSSGSGFC